MARDIKLSFTFNDWMSNLPSKLHNVPINGLAIPGSHDSATSYLTENSEIAPDSGQILKDIVELFGQRAKHIIYDWHVTQDYSFTMQLGAGIRYFDLRVAHRALDDDFYFVHGMFANKVSEAMEEVNDYLDHHTREIVLLDFNHFYAMTSGLHARFMNYLITTFGSKLCPPADMQSMTLSNLWSHGQQVLIFYHEYSMIDTSKFWPPEKIPSPWANTMSIGDLMTYLEKHYQDGHPADIFYVTQGILTPSIMHVLTHLDSTLKLNMSIPADQVFVPWLMKKVCGQTKMNIFICDFVSHCDYIRSVIALNYK